MCHNTLAVGSSGCYFNRRFTTRNRKCSSALSHFFQRECAQHMKNFFFWPLFYSSSAFSVDSDWGLSRMCLCAFNRNQTSVRMLHQSRLFITHTHLKNGQLALNNTLSQTLQRLQRSYKFHTQEPQTLVRKNQSQIAVSLFNARFQYLPQLMASNVSLVKRERTKKPYNRFERIRDN